MGTLLAVVCLLWVCYCGAVVADILVKWLNRDVPDCPHSRRHGRHP